MPEPVAACRAIEGLLPRMLAPRNAKSCHCPMYVNWIEATGVFDGRRLRHAVQISPCAACGLGPKALNEARQALLAFHVTTI